jgi:sec-independent protein translocase protein TatB
MFNIGGGELLVIAIVALVVLGPERLPSAARDLGKMMTELRSVSRGFRDELKAAVDLDALEKQSAEELAAEAEAFRRGDAHVAQRPPAGQAPAEQPTATERSEAASEPDETVVAPDAIVDEPGSGPGDPRVG